MSLVTVERYRIITGDQASASALADDALTQAVGLLEDTLQRPLEEGEITERLAPGSDGTLYPTVTPIVSAEGYSIYGSTIMGGPFFTPGFIATDPRVSVTYVGGYVERTANPTAANRLPAHVERDLCWAANRLLTPATSAALAAVPAGVKSASVGDASITYGDAGAPRVGNVVADVWSRETLRLGRVGRRI